jgi:type VI secretion system secreted protein VgrG
LSADFSVFSTLKPFRLKSDVMASKTFELISPLGPQLVFSQASLHEEVSGLFEYQVEVFSRMQSLDPKVLLGKPITIKQSLSDSSARCYNGYCTRLEQTGASTAGFYTYNLTVRPGLWFLSRRSDSRIFQHKSIPDVLKEVFGEEPRIKLAPPRLSGTYAPWDYCVQYRESTLNFVTRLMEQEGIYYFFEHSESEHQLVICDKASAHKPIDGNATLPFYRPDSVKAGVEHLSRWSFAQEIQPGKVSIDEYDPKQPSAAQFATKTSEASDGVEESTYEIFDYPGEYDTEAEGRTYVGVRLDEIQTQRLIYSASGDSATMMVGRKFKLDKHPLTEQNLEYFVTGTQMRFSEGIQEAGSSEGASISLQLFAIKASQQFRPARTTPKPIISGVQTAIVTGAAGDEIHTDEEGRGSVRVKFFWDRKGTQDEKSSCWIRTAMPSASGQFGFMALPRVGDEVVVTFLEGDPDRPLITGSVYNAENKPPYAYPANKTQSGLRTKSSKGGGADNFNEIFFEDKKGSEMFGIQAEKDHQILVKNNRMELVKAESHVEVAGDEFEKFGKKQHIEVKLDQSNKVGGTYSLKVGQDWMVKSGMALNAESGTEIHLKAGTTMVLESSAGLTLKVGGSFVSLTAGGIFISGPMVMINSGGSALSGGGTKLNAPDAPKFGKSNQAQGKKPVRKGKGTKPAGSAATLQAGAKIGSTLVEKCDGC